VSVTLSFDDYPRVDGWENPVTGFGTTRDKTTYGLYTLPAWLDEATLEAIYHGEDIAATSVRSLDAWKSF
jgi:hypothetical protein